MNLIVLDSECQTMSMLIERREQPNRTKQIKWAFYLKEN